MDKFKTDFLATQNMKPWVWVRYTDNIFFFNGTVGKKLRDFLSCSNMLHPNLKFTYKYSTDQINFLDVIVKKGKDKFVKDLYCKEN